MDPQNNNQVPAGTAPAASNPYVAPSADVNNGYGQYGPQPAVAPANYQQPPASAYVQPPQPPGGTTAQYMPPAPSNAMYQPPTQPAGPQVGGAPGPMPAPGAKPGQPAVRSNPNSTQNTLQMAEIRDGIVIMNDGSFRSVVMVKSINFDLMSQAEREAVEYAYQGFLNSLYFPIQIFMRSQKVDIRPYLERLDKIRQEHDNMILALLMEDYLVFIDNLALQTNIMDKKFYVVIPYFPSIDVQKALTQSKNFFSGLQGLFRPKEQHVTINEQDLATAKDELRNRIQAVLGGLQQSGIQGLPLDTQELIELYYDTYNPDTATRQQLKNFDDLSTPVVTKGQGQAPQPNLDRTLQ